MNEQRFSDIWWAETTTGLNIIRNVFCIVLYGVTGLVGIYRKITYGKMSFIRHFVWLHGHSSRHIIVYIRLQCMSLNLILLIFQRKELIMYWLLEHLRGGTHCAIYICIYLLCFVNTVYTIFLSFILFIIAHTKNCFVQLPLYLCTKSL